MSANRQRRRLSLLSCIVMALFMAVFTGCIFDDDDDDRAGDNPESPVVPPAIVSIAVTPATPAIDVAGTQQFTAIATRSDSTTEDVTDEVDWSSSDTDTATIDDTGLAHGVAEGDSTISAELGGVTGSTTLTVNPEEAAADGLVYIWPFNQDDLYVYDIQDDGSLVELEVSPVVNDTALGGDRVVTDNTGTYVFTEYTTGIYVSRVDRTDGSLTPLDASPFTIAGTEPNGLWAHPTQPLMYAVSWQSGIGNTIRAYDITGEGFTTSDSGTYVGSNYSVARAFTPDGAYFYMVGQDSSSAPYVFSLLSFEVDSTTGELTEILPRTTGVKYGMAVSPDGSHLFVGNYWSAGTDPGAILRYTIDSTNGALTAAGSTSFAGQPMIMTVDPVDPLLYVVAKNTDSEATLFVFEIDSDTGDLLELSATDLDPLFNINRLDMKVAPNGGMLYVSADLYFPGSGIEVAVYSVDSTTGDVAELQQLAVSSGLQPTILVIPPLLPG